jgi:hypothetical protein
VEAGRERRLRLVAVIAFGLLYFFSYLMTNLFYYGMTLGAFYAVGASGTATTTVPLFGLLLPLAIMGTLMVLSVYHRWAFHVLAAYVLAIQAFCIATNALMFTSDFFREASSFLLSFHESSNMLLMLLWQIGLSNVAADLLNLLLWLLPFAAYYALRLLARRAGTAPKTDNETLPTQKPPEEPTI